MDLTRACALFARTPGLTADHLRTAFAQCGDLPALTDADALSSYVKIPPSAVAYLTAPDQKAIDADLRWLASSNACLLPCTAASYPPLLTQTAGGPTALYVLGNVRALMTKQLAMVGSRNPTQAGRSTARDFAAFFVRCGLTITSGLALGIDAESHEGALAADGLTIAVCGNGLDRIYPRQNEKLARRIRDHGALVSEFPPGTHPARYNFPRRNRIISGLSMGTLVVEAARHSGSLITARFAVDQGRDVFAIPGSIHSALSRGCHQLIRDGAKLVERGEDVLTELQFFLDPQQLALISSVGNDSVKSGPTLDKDYEMLLDALAFEPASIDVLVDRTGFPGDSVASMLLILELEGRVSPQPGGRYSRLPEVPMV